MFGGGGAERRNDQETRSLLATYDYGYGTMILDGVEHVIAQYSTCSCPMQPAMDMMESLNTALYSCGKKFFSLLCPIVFSPFDRPLTHKSFFNIVYFSLISLR